MAGYVGSALQIQGLRRSDENVEWTRSTPGACNLGRMLGCDDVERLGWSTIFTTLERDGIFGFRLIPAADVASISAQMNRRGFRLDLWDVFTADRPQAMPRVESIVDKGLADGLREIDLGSDPEGAQVRKVQEFLLANGVVPFSGSMLLGKTGPASTIAIADEKGDVVAVAHSYMPHNKHSRHHRKAWGGLVAVAGSQRGKRLGSYVNAVAVKAAFEQLAAESIYELISQTNIASRSMVESCGLRLDGSIVSGAAIFSDGQKFTA